MTEDEFKDLTPEEQAQLAIEKPKLLEAWKSGSLLAKGWITAWRRKQQLIDEEAQDQANAIQNEIATKIGPEQGSLLTWCGFPTDMTRCSPFFPFNSKELGHREFLRDFVITSANWGDITYSGPQLSIYEEDVLMALLAYLEQVSKERTVAEVEGRKTYTYKGSVLPILRLLGHKRPGKREYARLLDALNLMTMTGIKLTISSGYTKSGKKKSPRLIQIVNMLSGVLWDEQKKELSATINPFFYESYLVGQSTYIDISKRMSLKGSIAKALYRFVQSHRQNPVFVGHFLTLADSLNLNRAQLPKQVRRLLKTAITELISQGVLQKGSGFVDQDIVKLTRTPTALPTKKRTSKSQKSLNS